jgi:hypothetical protein
MQTVVSCPQCGGQMFADPEVHAMVACPHCQAHVPLRMPVQPGGFAGAPPAPTAPYAGAEVSPPGYNKALASLILGICSAVLWLCPLVGLVLSIVGLVLGVQANQIQRRGMATAGIVLCIIGLALSAINAAVGAYLGATGQHDLLSRFGQP